MTRDAPFSDGVAPSSVLRFTVPTTTSRSDEIPLAWQGRDIAITLEQTNSRDVRFAFSFNPAATIEDVAADDEGEPSALMGFAIIGAAGNRVRTLFLTLPKSSTGSPLFFVRVATFAVTLSVTLELC